jgi:hypothetical protein
MKNVFFSVCKIYGMENGTLTYYGRLADVKECNPELFAVWQNTIRKDRYYFIRGSDRYYYIVALLCNPIGLIQKDPMWGYK